MSKNKKTAKRSLGVATARNMVVCSNGFGVDDGGWPKKQRKLRPPSWGVVRPHWVGCSKIIDKKSKTVASELRK